MEPTCPALISLNFQFKVVGAKGDKFANYCPRIMGREVGVFLSDESEWKIHQARAEAL